MRLQLLIQRHALPPVTIVYTTGTGPSSRTKSSSATIADLLSDINDLVPLESSDGEWGLEDYVVDVAATGDQHLTYECLHFQCIESVLREDDEVVIRALSNEDLRVRRLGGRHQITGDGRHLIDGVPFGKQWLRKISRPGIIIPPRKKRRLLTEDESILETEEDVKRILPADHENDVHNGALVRFTGNDEEESEDDDDDYTDEGGIDAGTSLKQVRVSENFDDADADSEDNLELDESEEDLASEIKQLLEDASEVEQASNLAIASNVLERQLKRKRPVEDDDEESDEEQSFEGFSIAVGNPSLPLNGTTSSVFNDDAESGSESGSDDGSDSLLEEITTREKEKRAKNIVDDDDDDSNDSDVTSDSDTSSSDSDADDTTEDSAMQRAKQRALNMIRSPAPPAVEDETSSSGSDSDDDEVSETTSSSGLDPDSDDDSDSNSATSSDSESESETETPQQKTKNLIKATQLKPTPTTAVQLLSNIEAAPVKSQGGIPFQGTNRTRSNNNRARRKKRLDALKAQGLLHPNANLQALTEYEAAHGRASAEAELQTGQGGLAHEDAEGTVKDTVYRMPEEESGPADLAGSELNKENVNPLANRGADSMDESRAEQASAANQIPITSQIDAQPEMEPTPKRLRLDVASTRRLVFGSLGLRVPKTAEEGQKLREKLSLNIRQPKQPKESQLTALPEASTSTEPAQHGDDSWKIKLIVSAVECEEPGGILPPPPFPFQQGWTKPYKNKRKMRDQSQYYEDRYHQPQEATRDHAPDVPTLNYDDMPTQTSDARTAPNAQTDAETLPSDQEFEKLQALEQTTILPGATIAYQELHVDASTNYQPAVSSYRVGQVSHVDEDGTVHLQLAKGYLKSSNRIDAETGEKIFGKFELEDDAEEEDDGIRDVLFSNMIRPKLVKSSSVQVPDSIGASVIGGIRGGEGPVSSTYDDVDLVPESGEQGVEAQLAGELETAASIEPGSERTDRIDKDPDLETELSEQIPQPMANRAPNEAEDVGQDASAIDYSYRFRRRSPRVAITSSEQQISSDVEGDFDFSGDVNDVIQPVGAGSVPTTSSPYMPTLTTVDYPHISQMDISSTAPRTTNSSSHQDAQKLSPIPVLNLSFTTSEQGEPGTEDGAREPAHLDGEQLDDQVHSEIRNGTFDAPESSQVTDSDMLHATSQSIVEGLPSSIVNPDDEGSSERQNSFLDVPGYDGNDSSYHDSGLDDDSDLPSLTDLLSNRRNSGRTNKRGKGSSPVPARKSIRNTTSRRKKNSSPPSSPELPSSSQYEIKQSQSQGGARLSQIPQASHIVDLTFSSDRSSPIGSPVKEPDNDSDSDYVASTRKNNKRKVEAKNTGRRTSSRGSKQVSQESGIGKRTLLTKKREAVPSYY